MAAYAVRGSALSKSSHQAAICLALVAAYALFDLRTKRHGGPLVTEGAH